MATTITRLSATTNTESRVVTPEFDKHRRIVQVGVTGAIGITILLVALVLSSPVHGRRWWLRSR